MDLRIRHANAADAAPLAELAARTFHDTFAADNDPSLMAIYMARSYNPSAQLAEITNPTMRTLLAEIAGQAVAYTQLRPLSIDTPPCVTGPQPCEIMRFYVDRPWIGRGVAQRLMETAMNEARSLCAKTIWLGVWEFNPRAIAFYRKFGFELVGDHDFLFADVVQTDLVMSRAIDLRRA
jgi:ribosomal protein S18 acetylase RimI-like enzyme